ncbi:MAG: PEP-CTERM sorting domain-containing protein [Pseudomonadales bacterium]
MQSPKGFSKYLKTLAAAPLLIASMSVSAALIEVRYEGTVNNVYGDGAGYFLGDVVSGSLFIDTDRAPEDAHSYAKIGHYLQNTDTSADFVGGYLADDNGLYDGVYLQDGYYRNRDHFQIMDRDYQQSNSSGTSVIEDRYFGLIAYDYSTDFIHGIGLEQSFELAAGDVQNMYGFVQHRRYSVRGRRAQYEFNNGAHFNLSRLSYGAVSVPEPGSMALLGLGMLGIFASGRRKR